MLQLQQRQEELRALGVDVAVVTFEATPIATNYARQTRLPWPVLLDESRRLYAAYGMHRGRWWDIWGPPSWCGYIKLLLRGRRLRRPTGDTQQLGGDVLIDPEGVVRLHHVGRGPVDRPAIESLLQVVRRRQDDAPIETGNDEGR